MKKMYIFLSMMLFLVCQMSAQSAWSITHSRNESTLKAYRADVAEDGSVSLAGISFKNLWVGSSVLWNVDDNAPIESPGIKGTLLYTAYENTKISIPIVGNISLNDAGDIITPDEGVSLGIYPYYELSSNDRFTLLLHGGVGYRRYSLDEAADNDQTEVKILGGLEMAFITQGDLPLTLNVTPVYRLTQGDLPNSTALEVTGILPIGSGLGFMAEGSFPFDKDAGTGGDNLFRLGIIVHGRL